MVKDNKKSHQSKICFVISPIGAEGSGLNMKFREILDLVIKPAVEASGHSLQVIRADDIQRPGSFVKDILSKLLNAYVVIADLTHKNANVFYELGVRHALSPRTILIAQSMEDVPSDLREYRTIIYEPSLKGSREFAVNLRSALDAIRADPDYADNPVLDRLSTVAGESAQSTQQEVQTLRNEIERLRAQSISKFGTPPEPLGKRLERILRVSKYERSSNGWTIVHIVDEDGDETVDDRYLPTSHGNFSLYTIESDEGAYVNLYIASYTKPMNLDAELADIRVLMGECHERQAAADFVIATDEDLTKQKTGIASTFAKLKTCLPRLDRKFYTLEVWDARELFEIEYSLNIRAIAKSQKPKK